MSKTPIFIIRDWERRGIRRRHAVKNISTMYFTDEDRGDGVKWTPYSLGVDAFLTYDEAYAAVGKQMDNQLATLQGHKQRLDTAFDAVCQKFRAYEIKKMESKP